MRGTRRSSLFLLLQPLVNGLAPPAASSRFFTDSHATSSRTTHRLVTALHAAAHPAEERDLIAENPASGLDEHFKAEETPENHQSLEKLYEEFSKYADKTAVAQEVIFEITSKEHFDDVVSRAAGADGSSADGYVDTQGKLRLPHKLLMVEVHAGWCRVCKGLQPKLLKLVKRHPEVLCCKINKTQNEELAAKLGVRGLPMIIFYKNGKRVDHFTTANINTIEEAIRDNT